MSRTQIDVSVLKVLNEKALKLISLARNLVSDKLTTERDENDQALLHAADQLEGSIDVTRYMVQIVEGIGRKPAAPIARRLPDGVKLVRGDQRPLTPEEAAARRKERMARLEEEAKKKREVTDPETPLSPDA